MNTNPSGLSEFSQTSIVPNGTKPMTTANLAVAEGNPFSDSYSNSRSTVSSDDQQDSSSVMKSRWAEVSKSTNSGLTQVRSKSTASLLLVMQWRLSVLKLRKKIIMICTIWQCVCWKRSTVLIPTSWCSLTHQKSNLNSLTSSTAIVATTTTLSCPSIRMLHFQATVLPNWIIITEGMCYHSLISLIGPMMAFFFHAMAHQKWLLCTLHHMPPLSSLALLSN